jgi:hypothetical protein
MGTRTSAPARLAFRLTNSVGIRDVSSFAARWLACTLPCRRFADILAEVCARLGADVGCYSFIVEDSHLLLLAGLPAHWRKLRPRVALSVGLAWRFASASGGENVGPGTCMGLFVSSMRIPTKSLGQSNMMSSDVPR